MKKMSIELATVPEIVIKGFSKVTFKLRSEGCEGTKHRGV